MFTKVNTWLLFCVFYCIETTLVAWVLTMDNLNKCKAISDSYIIIWSRCTKCCMVITVSTAVCSLWVKVPENTEWIIKAMGFLKCEVPYFYIAVVG